jgi:hypothetical protein
MNAEDAKPNPSNTRDDKDNDNDKDKEPTLANAPSTPDTPTAKKVQCPPGQEVSLFRHFVNRRNLPQDVRTQNNKRHKTLGRRPTP